MLLNKMKMITKIKKRMFVTGLILFMLVLMNFVSAQTCNVSEIGDVLKKALNEYLPAPELSKLNPQEIKDILGERVWVKARARYKNAVLYKLEIKEFAIKRRKNLKDYFGG